MKTTSITHKNQYHAQDLKRNIFYVGTLIGWTNIVVKKQFTLKQDATISVALKIQMPVCINIDNNLI